jgi:uncharacterized protein YbjT (DUF2867 family)
MRARSSRPVLVTGATGFVGRALVPALRRAGVAVRATSRRPPAAPRDGSDGAGTAVEWVEADLGRAADLPRALDGIGTAFFLVHGMAGGAGDYAEEERRTASAFAREAERAGVERIVYLGGVAPRGRPSRHLASRLAVGEVLVGGRVPALELRASMVIGAGSASWRVVRDLALRLPAMVLPSWAESRTSPIAIDDVVAALVAALALPLREGLSLDLPGPEVLPLREILERVAALRGRALPCPGPAPGAERLEPVAEARVRRGLERRAGARARARARPAAARRRVVLGSRRRARARAVRRGGAARPRGRSRDAGPARRARGAGGGDRAVAGAAAALERIP